jgi:hypothetical protein
MPTYRVLTRFILRRPLARKDGVEQILPFLSLPHSFAPEHSTTSLQSYCSALFAKNVGGGYTPENLFSITSALLPRAICTRGFLASSSLPAAVAGGACGGRSSRQCCVLVPLESRWNPVVFRRKTRFISFLFILLPDSSRPSGGVHPPPPSRAALPRTAWGDSTRREGLSLLPITSHKSPFTSHFILPPHFLSVTVTAAGGMYVR